jgi:tripartite-type tricarboxylate transporter receptor subunit TctC
MVWFRATRKILCLAAVGALASSHASAADFYKGQTVNFIIGSSGLGGSYDTYSRLLANHIGQFLPGNPSVVPQNMPGAGGIRAINYLYNVAPKDGTVIGMVDQAVYLSQILGTPELKADATKFNWIGRIKSNTAVLFVSSDAPVQKIEDALTKELIISASGTASRLNWHLLNNVVGTKIKMISGYKGAAESRLAMTRGEVHGLSMPWSEIKLQLSPWLAEKKITLLLQTSVERHPDLQNLPRMIDLAKTDADRQLLYLFSLPNSIGRSVVAPPNIPAERVAELRKAFDSAMADKTLLAEVEKAKLEIEPMSGEELQKVVTSSGNFPPALIKRAKEIAETR